LYVLPGVRLVPREIDAEIIVHSTLAHAVPVSSTIAAKNPEQVPIFIAISWMRTALHRDACSMIRGVTSERDHGVR
jgi:hypothetical protein